MGCGCEDLTGDARRDYHLHRIRIVKKTAKRIYYGGNVDEDTGVVNVRYFDRQKFEADGEIVVGWHWYSEPYSLHASPPEPRGATPLTDIRQLRREAAAVHPDRGGSDQEFREKYSRYMRAKSQTA